MTTARAAATRYICTGDSRPAAALPAAWLATACVFLFTGCTRYAEFTLPPPSGPAREVKWEWRQQPSPVLEPAAGWEAVDVLNPSVVLHDGVYYNFYSGFDGQTWHTGLAKSRDGAAWHREGRILSPDPKTWEGGYIAANGSALFRQGEFLYWYQAGPRNSPRIGLTRDRRRAGAPVLDTGPRGSWDERGVADPYVIETGGALYMYYLGQDRARRQRIGVARSRDGVVWQKLRTSPVLELGEPGAFDERGLGEPAVWLSHGAYWMLYTGRDRLENRRLGLARSSDGVTWKRVPGVFSGNQPWNSRVICDPSVEVRPEGIRVWFGGGDRASPDENLHGRIGLATLAARPASNRP